jgi:RsiW-degrading membrane proteinase PrsW (M82 family)
MSLGWKLFIVFIAFCTILTVVMYFAFRERKLGKNLAQDDIQGQQASDARVMTVIFSAILGGMLLTFLVAWLVFF